MTGVHAKCRRCDDEEALRQRLTDLAVQATEMRDEITQRRAALEELRKEFESLLMLRTQVRSQSAEQPQTTKH